MNHYSSDLEYQPLSKEAFPKTWAVLESGLAEGVAPGMVAGLWSQREPSVIRLVAMGQRRVVPTPLPMEVDTVFDLASVTKVFGTATLAALLVERRWITWDTPVAAFFPNFRYPEITLAHLLSHTAGYPSWEPLWQKLRDRFAPRLLHTVAVAERQAAMRELVFAIKPEAPVGERAVYSDISFLLLGFALEEVTQLPLDQAVRQFLWSPMGVQTAFYRRVTESVEKARMEAVAATEDCPWRGGVLQGQVHDDNCWAMGGYSGHAGAFGTARDVLHFSGRLLNRFLSPETLNAMWTRVGKPVGCERTLGWDTPSGSAPAASHLFSPLSVGHLGFTGTSLWIDPEAGLAVTLLTNRVHPSRENTKIKAFRPRFHEAIVEDFRRG